ncbi:MAG: fatty acid desaturase [Bacteroidota bacterium]
MGLFLYCLTYYFLAGLATVVGYHRGLTHRAFRMRKWFEYLVITLGLPAGTPVQWVGNHRFHHIHTDDEEDPHSPVVRGFWYAHNGWYYDTRQVWVCILYALAGPLRILVDSLFRARTNQEHVHLARDIAADPYYRFISRPGPYFMAMMLHILIPYSLVFWGWGWSGVVALWITSVLVFNLGDSIDSLAHLFGSQPYKKADHAKNNPWLAGLTFGGGWHADHHQFPTSAQLGLQKGQIDLAWWVIKGLKKIGLADDVKTIPKDQVQRKLKPISNPNP